MGPAATPFINTQQLSDEGHRANLSAGMVHDATVGPASAMTPVVVAYRGGGGDHHIFRAWRDDDKERDIVARAVAVQGGVARVVSALEVAVRRRCAAGCYACHGHAGSSRAQFNRMGYGRVHRIRAGDVRAGRGHSVDILKVLTHVLDHGTANQLRMKAKNRKSSPTNLINAVVIILHWEERVTVFKSKLGHDNHSRKNGLMVIDVVAVCFFQNFPLLEPAIAGFMPHSNLCRHVPTTGHCVVWHIGHWGRRLVPRVSVDPFPFLE